MVLIKKKSKQAQLIVPAVQRRSIEDIKLMIHKTITIERGYIYGCCILPDGKLALTYNSYKTVILFSNSGLKDFEVKMPCKVFYIAYISQDNALAVTSGNSEMCIIIVDIEKKQIKKTILLDSNSYGIALKDNRLIYSGNDKGIRMINLYNESIRDIVRNKMLINCYTATFRNNIYHTNYSTNTVTCYNLQGKLQWTFHNERALKSPHGIDVDNDGNVYVVGNSLNNVVVISPDGQRHREVLTANDGLFNPVALHYSGLNNQLLVANFNDTAFLFDLI
ncbi:unnamed protein product [Mytilus edulis]|uniref:Uncharacterized protein n=1 Tax=Mytilus edulis TaxID=6550 RepID=A0A8S3TIM5_MYTED|nr:unnamed protein product [Mytilus edulis]